MNLVCPYHQTPLKDGQFGAYCPKPSVNPQDPSVTRWGKDRSGQPKAWCSFKAQGSPQAAPTPQAVPSAPPAYDSAPRSGLGGLVPKYPRTHDAPDTHLKFKALDFVGTLEFTNHVDALAAADAVVAWLKNAPRDTAEFGDPAEPGTWDPNDPGFQS